MPHPDHIRLIARCAWLACHGEEERQGDMLARAALLHLVLRGEDIRPAVAEARQTLQSETKVRLQGGRIWVQLKGDDFARLDDAAARWAERLRIELYAALIPLMPETLAAAGERRALDFLALAERLCRESSRPEAMLTLKAGFLCEIDELITAPGPRAARDVADCVAHFHAQFVRRRARAVSPFAPPRPSAKDVQWAKLAPGLRRGELRGAYRFGPLRADFLEIAPKKWRLKTVGAGELPLEQRTLAVLAARHGARFGTSGGFALTTLDEPEPGPRLGEPIGLLVADGELLNPPGYLRSALLMDEEGKVDVWRVGPIGLQIRIRQATAIARKVDSERLQPGEIGVYTSAYRREVPSAPLVIALQGRHVVDVRREASAPPPAGGLLLAIVPGPSGLGPFVEIEPGDLVRYELPPMRGLGRITAAAAGGPALLTDGSTDLDLAAEGLDGTAPPILFGPRTRAAQTLGPRVAWGVTAEHLLIAACVDGGRLEDSVGSDLQELARLMRELGCVRAVNFDGATAGMLIDGRLSFAGEVRVPAAPAAPPPPLASAILVVERT